MESNVDRQTPVSESVSVPAPREPQPTTIATRPDNVSGVEPTSTMVLRSYTREGRSSAEKPEMQARPEVTRQAGVEILAEIPAPIHVTVGFESPRPDSVSEEMPVDKPETVPTFVFPARRETPSGNPKPPRLHVYSEHKIICSQGPSQRVGFDP